MGIKSKTLFEKIKRNNPYFEDFVTRSIYHSNAIEGNTLSFAETYAIVFNDNSLRVTAQPRELYEAINLKYAFNYILKNLDTNTSINFIKDVGILINKNINDIDGFRKTNVYIRGAEYIPPDAVEVPRLLSELIYTYKRQEKDDTIFQRVAKFHIEFERIHPFIDGNGRTSRLLITKELLSNGLAPVVIPIEYRSMYMKVLEMEDIKGLAIILEELSNVEVDRMQKFRLSLGKDME